MAPRALCGAACLALACLAAAGWRESGPRGGAVELGQGGGDDLRLFANSAPSYYMPGDTATDSDILPKEVLADDGSQSDRAAAAKPSVQPNFGSAHWYTDGQSKDLHGDLEQENRRRELAERKDEEQREANVRVQREREQRQIENRDKLQEAAREEVRRKAHRQRREHREEQRKALIQAEEMAKPHESKAYLHPFAAEKKGYVNLVMSEFKKDEKRMQATNEAIFGKAKKHHTTVNFLTADDSEPMTLHHDMKLQRERKLAFLKAKARQELHGKLQDRGHAGKVAAPTPKPRHHYVVHCTIEMLENGGCSRVVKQETTKERQARLRREVDGKGWRKSDGGHHWRGRLTPSNQPPTVGSVVGGWASDIGSLF